MNCSIERIQDKTEEAWILTIPSENVKDLLILLIAYKYDKIEKINLTDSDNQLSFQLNATMDKKGNKQPIFKTESKIITSNWIWFDAVVAMLLETCILGWAETAHIDYEFQTPQGVICVSLTVAVPNSLEN